MVRPKASTIKIRELLANARASRWEKVSSASDAERLSEAPQRPSLGPQPSAGSEIVLTDVSQRPGPTNEDGRKKQIMEKKLANARNIKKFKSKITNDRRERDSLKMKNLNLIRRKDKQFNALEKNLHKTKPPKKTMKRKFDDLSQSGKKKRLYDLRKKVQEEPFSGDINGRDGQKLLHYLRKNATDDIPYIDLFLKLEVVESFAGAKDLSQVEITKLEDALTDFISCYENTKPKIEPIEKTHLLKYHVLDFIKSHNGWGKFSEQGKSHNKITQ